MLKKKTYKKRQNFGIKVYGDQCPTCKAPVTYSVEIVGEIRGTLQLPTMKFKIERVEMRPVERVEVEECQ